MKSLSGEAKKAFINYFSGIDVQILLFFLTLTGHPRGFSDKKLHMLGPRTRHHLINERGLWGFTAVLKTLRFYEMNLLSKIKIE